MSADVLRRAASLMRDRAEAAADGPWEACALGSEGYAVLGDRPAEGRRRSRLRVARLGWEDWDTDKADAEHIASWHPAVAPAVADLLDALAKRVDAICDATPTPEFGERVALESLSGYPDALAVARAYLGESS